MMRRCAEAAEGLTSFTKSKRIRLRGPLWVGRIQGHDGVASDDSSIEFGLLFGALFFASSELLLFFIGFPLYFPFRPGAAAGHLRHIVEVVNMSKAWFKAAGIRAIKTVCQTAAGMIAVGAALTEVDWMYVLSVSVTAGILSMVTSLAGLPEVD